MSYKHTNHLIHETSPYLLQHAHNPVDWHPWAPESFEKARQENKPVLLSIGYSACHWCHVMEHESFENEETAALMNEHFVNIKVDREERPDLDQVYQGVIQLFGRNGGWPLTMFLTPDGRPFFGGTYFPPADRYGITGFPTLLAAVANAYREKQDDIQQTTRDLLQALGKRSSTTAHSEDLDPQILSGAVTSLSRLYDPAHGGFGSAPKFPNTMVLSLFLRHCHRTGEAAILEMVTRTLHRMAEGGIYDQVGGGFHRYSVDDRWLVPHFEKMLYDNALLSRLYIEAYQVTGDPFYRKIAEETLDYVIREMQSPEGGFYATQDADSEGIEGKYFIWTPEEIGKTLGEETGALFCRRFGVTPEGNFEGENILHVDRPIKAIAAEFGKSEEEIGRMLQSGAEKLRAVREHRVKPHRDEKVLTDWNGLMISAFAAAAMATGNPAYLHAARKAADFILSRLTPEGRLLRVYKDGQAKLDAFLDDYAFFAAALIDLFEATQEPSYLIQADRLTRTLQERFWDDTEGGFFFTGTGHEPLIQRPKNGYDHAIPSGNAVAAMNLLRLALYRDRPDDAAMGEKILRLYYPTMIQNPFGFAGLLCALDFFLQRPREIVIVGRRDDGRTLEMLTGVRRLFLPNRVLYHVDPSRPSPDLPEFARGKQPTGDGPMATVCRNFTCSAPVTDWEGLRKVLEKIHQNGAEAIPL